MVQLTDAHYSNINVFNDAAGSPGNLLASEIESIAAGNAGRQLPAEKSLNIDGGNNGVVSMENGRESPAGEGPAGENVINPLIKINGYKPLPDANELTQYNLGPEETKQVLETIRRLERTKVPEQLNGQQLIRIKSFKKIPQDEEWQKNGTTYSSKDTAMQNWLKQQGNYGVPTGYSGLIVVDFDEFLRATELGVIDKLPSTFTVKTRSGGRHYYYRCPELTDKLVMYDKELINEEKNLALHIGEVQTRGQYVVGPGSSFHLTDKKGQPLYYRDGQQVKPIIQRWEVFSDNPIAEISKEHLLEILSSFSFKNEHQEKKEKTQVEEQPGAKVEKTASGAGYSRWSDSLHVENVLLPDKIVKDERVTTGEITGSHPIHGSETGRNFSINVKKNSWICYRCHNDKSDYCGGGPWELLGIREGILSCDNIYKGWRKGRPDLWAEVLKKAEELGYDVPRLPGGDSISDYRRDLIRYAVEVIMGSEHIKTSRSGEVYIYDNGVYRSDGEDRIGSLVQQLGGPQTTNNVVAEVLGQIKRLTKCDFVELFDTDPYRLSVRNGILDLDNGTLEPHTPDFLTVVQIPVDYVPGADCPVIKQFMAQIVKGEDIPLLEEMAGYCLLRDYPVHKGFILLGEGRNGKSTWTRLIVEGLIGQQNCSSVKLQYMGRRFSKAQMKGKLLNFYTDIPDITLSITDDFKVVTSGDPCTIERKYYDEETIKLFAKQIFSANTLPKTMDETYGFFSRLILIDFPNRFEGDVADTGLLKKLITPEELSGFLNLAIQGLLRLLANQKFSYHKNVDEIAEEYNARSAPVAAITDFMTAATLKDTQTITLKDDLWAAYQGWEIENEEETILQSKDELMRAIKAGYAVKLCQSTVEVAPGIKDRKRAIKGLALSEEGWRLRALGVSITPGMDQLVKPIGLTC